MTESKRPLKVFLCHASADKPAIRDLYKRLTADGVGAWLDAENLVPGQNWQVEIPKAIRESDVVIVCLSEKSVNKEGYVQREIKFALDIADEKPEGTIFIVPVRLEECNVPNRLNMYHWVDLFDANGYEKLMGALRLRATSIGATLQVKRNWLPKIAPPFTKLQEPDDYNKPEETKKKSVDSKDTWALLFEDVPSSKEDKLEKQKGKAVRTPKLEHLDSNNKPQLNKTKSSRKPKTTFFFALISVAVIIIVGLLNLPANNSVFSPTGFPIELATSTVGVTLKPSITEALDMPLPTVTNMSLPPHPIRWLLYHVDGSIEALNLYNQKVISIKVNSCDNGHVWFMPEVKMISCNYSDTYSFNNDQFDKQDWFFERGKVNSFVLANSYYYSSNYGNGSELRKLDINGADLVLVDYQNAQISSNSQTNTKPYYSVDVMREYNIVIESVAPSQKYIVYRVDSLDAQSTSYWGGTGYMGTTPGPSTQRPSEYFILDDELGTKTRIYCDRFLYWSSDSKTVVCTNGAHDASSGARADVPYPTLIDHNISFAVWDSVKENLAFIEAGNIFVYKISTDEIKQIEKIGDFSYLDWLPGDKVLLSSNGDIYLIDVAKTEINQITTTPEDEFVIGWIQ